MTLNLRNLPHPKQLMYRLQKQLLGSNHKWEVAEILNIVETYSRPTIATKRRCAVCKSVKFQTFWYYKEGGYWIESDGRIEYSLDYHKSICKILYTKSHPIKRGDSRQKFDCEFCGSWHNSYYMFKKCKKQHEKKQFQQRQIKKNLRIIESSEEKFRWKLAIYRLYFYCNLTPKQIGIKIGENESYIKNVIADVFRFLCLSDNKCLFKSFFEGN